LSVALKYRVLAEAAEDAEVKLNNETEDRGRMMEEAEGLRKIKIID
jgi:hypothetical protein